MKEELDGVGWMVPDQDETHKVKNDKCNARLIYLGWKVIFHPMRNVPKLFFFFFFSLYFIFIKKKKNHLAVGRWSRAGA